MPVLRLRVMTYNIKGARNHSDGLEALARVIESQNPDVVGVQEVDQGASRSAGVWQAQWLGKRLGMHAVFGPALKHFDGGLYGVALLTRHPVLTHEVHPLPHELDADLLRQVPEAIQAYANEPRVVLSATAKIGEGELNFFVTHFGLTEEQRLAQAKCLVSLVTRWRSAVPAVVLGDFNATPDSAELSLLRQDFHDANEGQRPESRATRPPDLPVEAGGSTISRCVDYILVSGRITVEKASVIQDSTRASDHNPVVADLMIGV